MFCTNGVLLRMLTRGDGLSDITHVRLRPQISWAHCSQAAFLLMICYMCCLAKILHALRCLRGRELQLGPGHRCL